MKPRYLLAAAPQTSALANAPGIDLTIQGVFNILYGLTCWATSFIMVFIILILIWYGIQFMTTRGDVSKFAQARKNLTWAVIGIIVILGAQTIIATVANAINPNGQYQYFALFTTCNVPSN
ncbi:MAG TPA: pilin [Candidatus Paceibacterota bacterium]|nr:pilin [Candidatus Paceibacterota bacterium]